MKQSDIMIGLCYRNKKRVRLVLSVMNLPNGEGKEVHYYDFNFRGYTNTIKLKSFAKWAQEHVTPLFVDKIKCKNCDHTQPLGRMKCEMKPCYSCGESLAIPFSTFGRG